MLRRILALTVLLAPAPAFAQATSGTSGDEKLPAQLPSVTIQGEDRSSSGNQGETKVAPTVGPRTQRVRLPEPPQRRATSEGNKSLMVSVTPSTLEPLVPPAGPLLPYTSLTGGYGPLTQYRLGLYDTRFWGPALGITEIGGRSGWGWSDWHAKEWLDWTGVGRLSLRGDSFQWNGTGPQSNGSLFVAGGLEHGDSPDFQVGLDSTFGRATSGGAVLTPAGPSLDASRTTARAQFRPAPQGDHQLTFQARGQLRAWGTLRGPEAYLSGQDFWSLSDAVQLEAGLGGGQWGFEPILDPKVAFHYRPQPETHLFTSLRTESVLPDFEALYLRRPAVELAELQAERVEGRAELGASHRWSTDWFTGVTASLKRSHRHIFWSDADRNGLWRPLNALAEQWSPQLEARVQRQWLPALSQEATASWRTVNPLGFTETRLGTSLDGVLLSDRLGLLFGVEGRMVTLGSLQVPGGASGSGVFGEAELTYRFTPDWAFQVAASELPLVLNQPSANYFVPIPLLTANLQVQF